MVNFLWGNSSIEIRGDSYINPFAMPMLSFHGVIGPGVTLGGGIGYAATSGDHETIDTSTGATMKSDDPKRSAFAFSPKVGYLASFSPVFAIWPRGGITYWSQQSEETASVCDGLGNCTDQTVTSSLSGVSLDLDFMFVLSPVPHVGIVFGPVADIGVSGTRKVDPSGGTPDLDVKVSNFGLAAGIALLF
jgi:hypothetical protein